MFKVALTVNISLMEIGAQDLGSKVLDAVSSLMNQPQWAKIIILVAIALALLVAVFVSEDPTIVSSLSFVALFFTLSRMAFRLTKSNKL
ncbi:hypothetical protein [Paenibacillus rhizoplanae]|uniref:Uncharacterized protein n=1 Tax=Paenibacillus rhizoplanae TaxID=1917181 RepID=A0ABW5FCF7_9BACL